MKTLAILLLSSSMALAATSPLDQVKTYAHGHKVTVRHWNGKVWIEAEGLDPFGIGKTVDEAAREFMKSARMMDHENPAYLKYAPSTEKPCDANDTSAVCQNDPL
jgi:hypothetical protein